MMTRKHAEDIAAIHRDNPSYGSLTDTEWDSVEAYGGSVETPAQYEDVSRIWEAFVTFMMEEENA